MYLIQLGGVVYEPKDGRPGFTLPEAMREVRGVAAAWILRADGTVAVMSAGSDVGPVLHISRKAGPPRRVFRRPAVTLNRVRLLASLRAG